LLKQALKKFFLPNKTLAHASLLVLLQQSKITEDVTSEVARSLKNEKVESKHGFALP
jgi:hypothetical protein